jgi:hypothetical protein
VYSGLQLVNSEIIDPMYDKMVKMSTPNQILSYIGSPSVKRLNRHSSDNFTEYSVVQKSSWIANRHRIMWLPSDANDDVGKTAPVETAVTV